MPSQGVSALSGQLRGGRTLELPAFWGQGDLELYLGMPVAEEHAQFDLATDARVFHFTRSEKPSWYAWYLGRGEKSVADIRHEVVDQYAAQDPQGVIAAATRGQLGHRHDLHWH